MLLTPINFPRFSSQLHSGLKMGFLPPSRSHLIPIQVLGCVSHLHPGPVSPASGSQLPRFKSHLHASCTSPISRSRQLHLTSMQVPPHIYPGLWMWVSPSCRSLLTSFQVQRLASQLHPGPILPPSMSGELQLTSIQVLSHIKLPRFRFASPLQPTSLVLCFT